MILDRTKDIESIGYNHLNLPVTIRFQNGGDFPSISYIYNAKGVKVGKIVETAGRNAVTTTTDYLDGYQYVNDALQFFPTAEGYVKITEDKRGKRWYSYVYNYTDHLGNVRLSYENNNNVLTVLEENNYYPFGLKHNGYNSAVTPLNPKNKYKFNGKELQDELGLNLYDYGARNYDPALGRWMNIDPLAEVSRRWSPYAYCYNNPMLFVDPDGMLAEPTDWIKNVTSGKYEWRNEVTSPSTTPEGYSYVGKEDGSIVTDLFSTSNAKTSDWDAGLISTEDFDNPYSAQGAAFMNMKADTTLSINISADVSTTYNSDGSIQSKDFKGVNIDASVSGEIVAPYPGVDISLAGSTTLQNNEMKTSSTSPNGNIIQGGDVPTLTYSSYWNSSSIQSNFGKSFNLNFNFKGQYSNGNFPMSFVGAAGLLGVPNPTNLSTSIKFNNKP
jgi:RHS repeat-associated protein